MHCLGQGQRDFYVMALAFTVNSLILYLDHFEVAFMLIEVLLLFLSACMFVLLPIVEEIVPFWLNCLGTMITAVESF